MLRVGRGLVSGIVLVFADGMWKGSRGWVCDGVVAAGAAAGAGSVVGAVVVSTFVGYLASLAAVARPLAIALTVETLA